MKKLLPLILFSLSTVLTIAQSADDELQAIQAREQDMNKHAILQKLDRRTGQHLSINPINSATAEVYVSRQRQSSGKYQEWVTPDWTAISTIPVAWQDDLPHPRIDIQELSLTDNAYKNTPGSQVKEKVYDSKEFYEVGLSENKDVAVVIARFNRDEKRDFMTFSYNLTNELVVNYFENTTVDGNNPQFKKQTLLNISSFNEEHRKPVIANTLTIDDYDFDGSPDIGIDNSKECHIFFNNGHGRFDIFRTKK